MTERNAVQWESPMRTIAMYVSEHGIKILIVIKILVIGFIVLEQKGGIYWGDKNVLAQEPAAVPAEAKSEEPSLAQNTGEGTATTRRRSFLDDILELPKLSDSSDLKKDELARYMNLIEKKKSQLDERYALLVKREEKLRGIEKSVEEKINKLQDEVRFFDQSLQKEKEIQTDRLDQLVEFYKKMPPKKAAPVFENMDKDLVVALFKKIPQKQTTEILAQMTPKRSIQMSEYFGRIRSGNEYDMLKQMNTELVKEFSDCKGMPQAQPDPALTPPPTPVSATSPQ